MTEEQPRPREDDEQPSEGLYSVGRLLALSDGVFAIAMTLLVLTIAVPELPAQPSQAAVTQAALQLAPALGTFALSFFLAGMYWVIHHRIFARARGVDARLLWLNLVVLLLVCLFPFSTSFYIRFPNSVAGLEIYYGNQALTGLAVVVLTQYGARSRMLPADVGRRSPITLAVSAVFLAAMLVALWNVSAARFMWIAIPPVAVLVRLLRRRRRGAQPPEHAAGRQTN